MNPFMKAALMAGMESLQSGHGGPFGAAVVRDGKIVAVSGNRVYETQDPTMHAEVAAIRLAAERLGTRDLSGCTLYSTSEPCPMCLCAAYWAKITRVCYGCSRQDALISGFHDKLLYDMLEHPEKQPLLSVEQMDREACQALFDMYLESKKRG